MRLLKPLPASPPLKPGLSKIRQPVHKCTGPQPIFRWKPEFAPVMLT
jgi:hypothetical protein